MLLASEQVAADVGSALVVGELGLDGAVHHTTGVLSMAALAREQRLKRIFVPAEDAAEAALIDGLEVIPIRSLWELIGHLADVTPIAPFVRADVLDWEQPVPYGVDLAHIKGQEQVKRGLEVAAAGGHNLFTFGTGRCLFDFPSGESDVVMADDQDFSPSARATNHYNPKITRGREAM